MPHNLATNPLADNLSLDVAARSRHPGGVHVLYGKRDGPVRDKLDESHGLASPGEPKRPGDRFRFELLIGLHPGFPSRLTPVAGRCP